MEQTATGHESKKTRVHPSAFPVVVSALLVLVFSFGLLSLSQKGHQLSLIDEHIHFDTAIRAMHGEIPARGDLLSDELVQEWACGVGHEGGGLPYPCGDRRLSAEAIPSGKYTTGYVHYPTYFFGAAVFFTAIDAVTGSADPLDAFRAYSALTLILGVIATAIFAWLLGLRDWRLVAATMVPIATSMVVFTGTILNPSSTAILAGALIGGTGLLWVKRGKGFVWFALAVAFSSAIAVTDSLPAGGFLIAMLVALVGGRFEWVPRTAWTPRWWQFVTLVALILAPVIAWGRVIASRATVPNDALYGFVTPTGRKEVLVGAVQELSLLHSPWRETYGIRTEAESFLPQLLHAFSVGAPSWISVLVIGTLVLVAVPVIVRRLPAVFAPERPRSEGSAAATMLLQLVALGTVATLVLYPPALRISNWVTMGFDYPIVDRYSNALAPVLVFALLMLVRHRWYAIPLSIIGGLAALGTVAAGF